MATLPKGYVEPFLCFGQSVLVQMLTYLKLPTEIKTHSVFEWDLNLSSVDMMGNTAGLSHRTHTVVEKCSLLLYLADE